MSSVHSRDLAGALIEALGLPKRCRVIEIRIAAGEVASVRCEHFPDEKPARDALAVISTFQLVPVLTAQPDHLGDQPTTPPLPGATTTEG